MRFIPETTRKGTAFFPVVIDTEKKTSHEVPLRVAIGGFAYEKNCLRFAKCVAKECNKVNDLPPYIFQKAA